MIYYTQLIILLIFIIYNFFNYHKKYILYIRSLLLNKVKNKKCLIYLVNSQAGLANTLRGVASTIILSFLFNTSFFLKGWNSVIYYFDYPRELLYYNNMFSNYSFKKFNITILKILEIQTAVIEITDIHGFMDYLIFNRYSYYVKSILTLHYSIKKISKRLLNSIIYKEIFIPSKEVLYYNNIFNIKRRRKKVLGIHIRSGIFSNNYTEQYFSRKIELILYYTKAEEMIQKMNLSYVFTLSDNIKYLTQLKSHFHNVLIDISFKGDIVHSKFYLYNPIKNNNAIRIISEFILLSNCDYIIGTKRSTFSAESCNRLMTLCCAI